MSTPAFLSNYSAFIVIMDEEMKRYSSSLMHLFNTDILWMIRQCSREILN
jgi:hypothetical protein